MNPTGRRANDLNKQLEGVTCKLDEGEESRLEIFNVEWWGHEWRCGSSLSSRRYYLKLNFQTFAMPVYNHSGPSKNISDYPGKKIKTDGETNEFVFSSSSSPSDKRVHMHIKRSVWNLYWAHQKKYPNGNKSFIIFKEILFQFPLDLAAIEKQKFTADVFILVSFRIFCSSLGWTRGITTDL